LGVARKLIAQGRIPKDESIVLCITGNGLKTQEVLQGKVGAPTIINAKLSEFDDLYSKQHK
ncbi:MAG: threonine synthase, partial [Deltaproteobacteria bacterium]|nr:threonine synthase [Deltaproteobacteria bacterium]